MNTIHKIIYSCEEASKLVVQKADGKLSQLQKFRIWLHLQICGPCKKFEIQNEWIDKQIHKIGHNAENATLSEEQKERIAKNIAANK